MKLKRHIITTSLGLKTIFFFFQDDFGNLRKLYILLKSQVLTSSTEEKAAN